jgi:hypothetical protein
MNRTTRPRRGTTLVELLVAAAMLMLGMWLLVWLYQQGMASFINAKSQADLTTQERTVATVLARDLSSPFFLDEDNKPNRGRRLSDQRPDLGSAAWTPPRGGFFWARSTPWDPANPTPAEGTAATRLDSNAPTPAVDSDGFYSVRATNHCLQFTILLPGGANYQEVGAELSPGTGNQVFGTAAEVTYALVPNGSYTAGDSGTQIQLYDLIRRQRLTALTGDDAPAYTTQFAAYSPSIAEVATFDTTANAMRSTLDLTVPPGMSLPAGQTMLSAGQSVTSYRLPVPPNAVALPSTSGRYGEDKLMSNVISFEVKFTGPQVNIGAGAWGATDAASIYWPRAVTSTVGGQGNTDYPYDYLPYNGEFDTCSAQVPGWQSLFATKAALTNPIKPIRITGVLIRLRGYDLRNQTTRQTTIASRL